MPLALLWKSSQVGEFIRESRTLLLLINLNKQNDFTFYQTPHSYPFFVEFSFSRSGFLAWTERLSGFSLWHQVGGLGVIASLEKFSSHRDSVCLFCFVFSFFCTVVSAPA